MRCDAWLVATHEDPPAVEVRAFWNCKENAVDELEMGSPRIWLGVLDADEPGGSSGASRVSALIFLRGTLPEYILPVLDDALEAELLGAFAAAPDDYELPRAAVDDLRTFLAENGGSRLFTTSAVQDSSPPL